MNHGLNAEEQIKELLYSMVGEDFVFHSPLLAENSGKKIELTDFLVLLDDVLISMQSKSIDIDIEDINEIKIGRIFRKYENAKSQLNRTLNSANRGEKVILTANHLNDQIELPWSNFKHKIIIVTLNIPDNLYSDPEYRFQFIKYEEYKGISLHTFVLQDLVRMVDEIKSGGDLLQYLETRKLLSKIIIQPATNELDIMALYKTNYPFIEEELINGKVDKFIIAPGSWEAYQETKSKYIQERDEKIGKLTIIDSLIKDNRASISFSIEKYGYSKNEMIAHYLRIIGILNSLSTVERYIVEQMLKEKYDLSDQAPIRYFIYPFRSKAIFFLVSNESDREIRKKLSLVIAEQATLHLQKTMPDVETLLCIVTEGRKIPGRSFDTTLLNVQEIAALVKELPEKLFKNKDKGRVDEWSI
ncbi:hypothetical protein [Leptospira sp. id769339]|uniref:hypothetical protein n=1 Tax=Leptospira sp. id769339 TaxID=2864221 RepID=UPI00214B98D2|nr:hypothetical protein [Leptospira sp. id769339]MCR1795719.1 hypothetical protein [Leptospira sp. id769339]